MEKRQSRVPTRIRTPDRPARSQSTVAAQLVTFSSIYNTLGFSIVTASDDVGNSLEKKRGNLRVTSQ